MSPNRTRINLSRIGFTASVVSDRRFKRKSIRRMARALPPVFCALLCLFGSLFSALAQDNFKHTQNTADSSLRGDLQVDPSTLGMTLQIPLGEYPGRNGVNLPVTLSYGSKQWRIDTEQGFPGISTYHTQSEARYAEHSISGWTSSLEPPEIQYLGGEQPFNSLGDPLCTFCLEVPEETPYYIDRLLVHMPDGSSHELRKSDMPVLDTVLGLTGIYYAVDSSQLKFDADTATLYMPDGSRYLLAAPGGVQFIDRNGNTLSYNSTYKQWTDTLGRVISLPPLQNSAPADLQYWLPGFGATSPVGAPNRMFTFLYRYLSDVRTDPSQPLRHKGDKNCPGYPETSVSPSLFNSVPVLDSVCWGGPVFNPVVLWQIVLPNNSSYIFTYNIYGEIDKVRLPTGGYQRFTYAAVDGLSDLTDPYRQANRGVIDHWISAKGDGTDEVHWQYSAVNDGLTKLMTTVIGPNGAKSERLMHKGVNSSLPSPHFGFEDSRAGRAYEERTYAAGGQMIRRTLVNWTMDSAQLPTPHQHVTVMRNPRGVKKVEILLDTGGNALAATTTTGYDNDLNEIAANRYDYVSVNPATAQTGDINSFSLGTLLRTEESKFLVNDDITYPNPADRQPYRDRHLIALPSFTQVKNGSTVVAEMQFKYDQTAYPVLTYGATPTGWTAPPGVRGNLTTTRRWLNLSGATVQTYPNGSFLETHAQYDQCGNLRKAWDAKNNLSQVSYTDNFSDSVNRNTFAYPTSSTSPVPDASGYYGSNQSFTSSTAYEFNTGKVVTTADANNQTTTYSYHDDSGNVDPFLRLRKVTLPGGLGETKHIFGDTPGDLYIRTLTKQNSTTWLEDRTNLDGLGRAKRSGHYEGPSSWSVKDTEYDTLGRVKRVTNPYFAANLSGAIPGAAEWTTNTYDDLNRVLTVTAPDGSKVETTYSGAQVTMKDPANRKRRSVTDAMGRLAQVVEDPDGEAYQTNYSYNTLGNLTVVN
ncbi:MAG: RHS repeat domain-containing protein, partial [Blastocatellia bacterium]